MDFASEKYFIDIPHSSINGMEKLALKSCRVPTEVTDENWIYIRNKTTQNNQRPVNCGKWLIFEPYDKINDVWSMIEKETENGELGFASKVSTMKDKEERDKHHGTGFVICVYTYDHKNEEDVMRVRERLKELGFHRKLSYKTDEATLANIYRSTNGGKRVSKWYC